jgi:hypothetical protein
MLLGVSREEDHHILNLKKKKKKKEEGYEKRYQSESETHDERMWLYRWIPGCLIDSLVFSSSPGEKCDFLVGDGHGEFMTE